MSGRLDETPVPVEILDKVRRLHAEVDSLAADLAGRIPGPLVCGRGCCDCCVDDLSIFPVEAALIRTEASDFLNSAEPHPTGQCAFLDEVGSCRIYPWRPYVCRSQGFPLRWLEEDQDGEEMELRDICPLNDNVLKTARSPLENLSPDQCWTLGDFESRLAGLQASITGFSPELPRLLLRSLFQSNT